MKFKTSQELLEFMNTIDLDKSVLVFKPMEGHDVVEAEHADCGCDGGGAASCACDSVAVTETTVTAVDANQILVESLSDSPSFKLVVEDSNENIFFVKDYEAQRDACGTGSITLENRVSYMNMCEMDNSATVTLDIVTEGKKLKGVPFRLVKTEGETYLQVSKNQLL